MRDTVSSIEGAIHEHLWQNCMLSRILSFRNRSCATTPVSFATSLSEFDVYDAALERFLQNQPKSVPLQKGVLVNVFVANGRTRESKILDVSNAYYSAEFGGAGGTTYLSRYVPNCYCYFSGGKVLSQVPLHCCFVRSSITGHITMPLVLPRWRAAAKDRVMSECLALRRGAAVKTVDGVARHVLFNDTECRVLTDYNMISFGYSKVSDTGRMGNRPVQSAQFARSLCTDSGCIGLARALGGNRLHEGVNQLQEDDIICTFSSYDWQQDTSTPVHGRSPERGEEPDDGVSDSEEEEQQFDFDSGQFEDDEEEVVEDTEEGEMPPDEGESDAGEDEEVRQESSSGVETVGDTTETVARSGTSSESANGTTPDAAGGDDGEGGGGGGDNNDRPPAQLTPANLCDPYHHRCCAVFMVSGRRLAGEGVPLPSTEPDFAGWSLCNPQHICCQLVAQHRATRAAAAARQPSVTANDGITSTAGANGGTATDGAARRTPTTTNAHIQTDEPEGEERSTNDAHSQTDVQSWRVQLTDDIVSQLSRVMTSRTDEIEAKLRKQIDTRFDSLMSSARNQTDAAHPTTLLASAADAAHPTTLLASAAVTGREATQTGGTPLNTSAAGDGLDRSVTRNRSEDRSATEDEDAAHGGGGGGGDGETHDGGESGDEKSAHRPGKRAMGMESEQMLSTKRAKPDDAAMADDDGRDAASGQPSPQLENVDVETIEVSVVQRLSAYGVARAAPAQSETPLKWMQHSRKFCLKLITILTGAGLAADTLRGSPDSSPCTSLDELISRQPPLLSAVLGAYRDRYSLTPNPFGSGGPRPNVVEGVRMMVNALGLKLAQRSAKPAKPAGQANK